MRVRTGIVAAVLLALVIAAVWIGVNYSRDIQTIRQGLAERSQTVSTSFGDVQFESWGEGPPVIVIHGAGGGFDQGRLMAETFGGDGFRWIAVSRFGYLGSALPNDGSTAAQADALAELLEVLQIDRVGVFAMSGGVPPALQFAIRHGEQVFAMTLLSSAPYTPFSVGQDQLPIPGWLYRALFSWDFPYWALSKVAPRLLEPIYDVKPDLRANLTLDDAAFLDSMVASFLPVTRRTTGLANEAAAIDPDVDYPLEEIEVPTLVIHARDDGIAPFTYGERTADGIADSTLVTLDDGGHLMLGHVAEVEATVNVFLHEHLAGAAAD